MCLLYLLSSFSVCGLGEDFDGGVEDGVVGAVVFVHVNAHVGGHAELGESSLGVHDGAGGEAHTPAVGQFAGEGQPTAAARGVAHDGDLVQRLHDRHEVVGGAERAAASGTQTDTQTLARTHAKGDSWPAQAPQPEPERLGEAGARRTRRRLAVRRYRNPLLFSTNFDSPSL